MIRKISIGLVVLALTTSCVSKKVYTDLENKYIDLKKENRKLLSVREPGQAMRQISLKVRIRGAGTALHARARAPR